MFLSICNNRTGEEFIRRLGPNASLDLRQYVTDWASEYNCKPSFSEPGSYIPNGCADWQAEIRRTKRDNGSCWSAEPFYLESVE
jgi:hypothetical protein